MNLWKYAYEIIIVLAIILVATTLVAVVTGCRPRPTELFASIPWSPPITISMQDDPSLGWERELRAAVKLWNNKVGCTVFKAVDDHSGDVYVMHGGPPPKSAHRDKHYTFASTLIASPDGDPTNVAALVQLHNVPTSNLAYGVLVHELGHVVGVPDDEHHPQSFMFYGISFETDTLKKVLRLPDALAVRGMYCPVDFPHGG